MKAFKYLPLVLCFAIVGTASAQDKTKGFLDELGYAYATLESGAFKVVVSVEGVSTPMVASEKAIWGRDDLDFMKVISVYTLVMNAPEGFNPPAAMYRKIVELSDGMLHGRLSMYNGSIFFSSEQGYGNATAQSMDTQLVLAHFMTQEYKKEFEPYLEEE
ncbi:MAG: hypothetical protein HKN43_01390 [Rhodothermales bacterium]|nr:hypothetical protein [Rhodothermales bacterium]